MYRFYKKSKNFKKQLTKQCVYANINFALKRDGL